VLRNFANPITCIYNTWDWFGRQNSFTLQIARETRRRGDGNCLQSPRHQTRPHRCVEVPGTASVHTRIATVMAKNNRANQKNLTLVVWFFNW